MAKYFIFALFFVGFTAAPLEAKRTAKRPELTQVHLVDRNGFTETVTSKDRLEKFAHANFLSNQPYEKVLRVYTRDSGGNIPALVTTYHTNGQVKQYFEARNGQAHGLYQEWYPSGQVKLRAYAVGGSAELDAIAQANWLFDKEALAYDEEGNLIAEIHYNKGALHGESLYYYSTGELATKIPYNSGLIHGDFNIYSRSGELLQKSPYVHGQMHGTSLSYWPGDKIAATEEFHKGLLLQGDYFNSEGEKISSINDGDGKRMILSHGKIKEIQEYRDGSQSGAVWQYNNEGKPHTLLHVKEGGIKHGEEIVYHPNGKPKLSIEWYDGSIQGTVKSWYLNGAQESAREMSKNKKEGHSMAWYPTGDLMLMERYEKDHLIEGQYFKKGERDPITRVVDGNGTATLYDKEGTMAHRISYENGRPTIDR